MDKQNLIRDRSDQGVSRRKFLSGAGSFLLTKSALGLAGCESGSPADIEAGVPVEVLNNPDLDHGDNKPNFVFILTDDHRWDHLSVMGHPFLETPNIDRLANEGMLFENAFVITSLCSPSRASFLTGQYARNHGVQNNLTPWDESSVTFMEILAKAAHHQFLPPKDLDDLYSDVDISFLPDEYFSLQTMLDRNIWEGALGFMEKHYRNYNETLVGVDRELGRLIETLESRALMDNTVIIYAGDNGYSWGEHVLVGKRWASEENLRIPFIIRFPERLGFQPERHDGYVLNVDLAPTILDLAGLSVPVGMDGRSILSLVGDQRTTWRDAFVYEYFQDFPYNVPAQKALRTDQFLYVVYARGKEPELFDVTADPRTLENIIDTPTGKAALPGLRQKMELEEAKL